MDLTIRHLTRYSYEPEAAEAAMRLKLYPPEMTGQRVVDWSVTVNGAACAPLHRDGCGDRFGLWRAPAAVDAVEIIATGQIATSDTNGVVQGLASVARAPAFLRDTALTDPGPEIAALAEQAQADNVLARMHALSSLVSEAVEYRKNVTEQTTTAQAALALGAGVCQDQTHVFITAARILGVPARYVVGYLSDPEAEAPTDETHAWAEAHIKDLGWVGFDITNQLCPTDRYVRLCSGFDAADAAPLRGTHGGDAEEAMTVEVSVVADAEPSQSQSQSQS